MNSTVSSIFDAIPEHPVQAMLVWLDDARNQGVLEPTAVALATSSLSGIASNRIVQILGISEAGLVFATHSNSPKGLDINATRWGSCVFHWPQVKRQIIVAGHIDPLQAHESDVLWSARPPQSHAMSTVSTQSAVLLDEAELRQKALKAAASGPLIRPDKWTGYRQQLHTVEFWQFSPDRLYKRLKYTLTGRGWTSVRLQP